MRLVLVSVQPGVIIPCVGGLSQELVEQRFSGGNDAVRVFTEIERDDFDRWISWMLAADSRNTRPPKQVWQQIVHRVFLDSDGSHTGCGRGQTAQGCSVS